MEEFQTNLFDSRTVKKELAKAGIKSVKRAALMLRITITAIFFEKNITTRYTASSADSAKISL